MRKNIIRIVSLIIAVILVLGLFSGAIAMFAYAADPVDNAYMTVTSEGNDRYTIEFSFYDARINSTASAVSVTPASSTSVNIDSTTVMTITQRQLNYSFFDVKLEHVRIPQLRSSLDLAYTAKYTVAGTDYEVSGKALYRTATPTGSVVKVITADTTVSKTLTYGKVTSGVTINFNYIDDGTVGLVGDRITFDRLSMPEDSSFGWSSNTRLTVKGKTKSGSGGEIEYYQATLSGVSYTGGSMRTLELTVDGDVTFSVPIPSKYFSEASGDAVTSDIVVQSAHVYDASGTQLATVDKNTRPFSVEVIYYDINLGEFSKSELEDASKNVFLTNAPGFKPLSGTSGTLELLSTSGDYPRFKATFKNLTSDGTGTALGFRVQYNIEGREAEIKGEGIANLFQVITPEKEEADELAPLRPNIIVEQYSYGAEQITAGSEFDLELRFSNTSSDLSVENVVMTIEPNSGFVIASASNTAYFPNMVPGESKPFSIKLRAAAAAGNTTGAPQTDYSVQIKFAYQYLSKKEYASGEASVKIAIPVVQLDRFTVDEITQYSQYLQVGEEGFITVPLMNKGKSLIYNVSGVVKSQNPESYISPVEHAGNFEAGKSGEINLSVIINVPGEFNGDAVISYEDENSNQKEVSVPFTIMVMEPPPPNDMLPPTDIPVPEAQGPGLFGIIMSSIGSLMIAAPVALYFIKRVKAKGIEDFDEDF